MSLLSARNEEATSIMRMLMSNGNSNVMITNWNTANKKMNLNNKHQDPRQNKGDLTRATEI